MTASTPPPTKPAQLLSIGALARAVGVPVETLRTWERRYGVPSPERTGSGHRRYSLETLERLQLVRAALRSGHRPSLVLHASVPELRLLADATASSPPTPPTPPSQRVAPVDPSLGAEPVETRIQTQIRLIQAFDGVAFERELRSGLMALGALSFLEDCVAPLLREIGECWSNLGLLRALAGFEPQRGLRFATYAAYWIRADVLALILRQRSMVGGGRGHLRPTFFFRLRREHAQLSMLLGDAVKTRETLAARWKLEPEELNEILERLDHPDASLEASAPGTRGAMVEAWPAAHRSQEEELARKRTQTRLSEAVQCASAELNPREQFILEHRLMADPESEYSLVYIGKRLGVSRERARQLESRVKEKLRAKLSATLGTPELLAHLSVA